MMAHVDQMGREVNLAGKPQRIVSLVPSQTELLFSLGVGDHVVGRTKFCIHPGDQVKDVQRVGGTKNINMEVIDKLDPDLIIGNKEENEKSQIEALEQKYSVWMSDVRGLNSAVEMIMMLGEVCRRESQAIELTSGIQKEFRTLKKQPLIPVAYLIWHNPMMVAGAGTFIDKMLHLGNFENVVDIRRYPEVEMEQLSKASCLMLSSEPYPFKATHIELFKAELPNTQIKLVDGELFSWYGSRLLKTPAYLRQLYSEVSDSL